MLCSIGDESVEIEGKECRRFWGSFWLEMGKEEEDNGRGRKCSFGKTLIYTPFDRLYKAFEEFFLSLI